MAQRAACFSSTLEVEVLCRIKTTPPRITAVDYNPDTVFVTFANGMIVTYHASLIFSLRNHDGNQILSEEDGDGWSELEVEKCSRDDRLP